MGILSRKPEKHRLNFLFPTVKSRGIIERQREEKTWELRFEDVKHSPQSHREPLTHFLALHTFRKHVLAVRGIVVVVQIDTTPCLHERHDGGAYYYYLFQ